jgi:hypothetical protein
MCVRMFAHAGTHIAHSYKHLDLEDGDLSCYSNCTQLSDTESGERDTRGPCYRQRMKIPNICHACKSIYQSHCCSQHLHFQVIGPETV